MKPIKEIIGQYASLAAAGKALGYQPTQLNRWVGLDALVSDTGAIYIKSRCRIKPQLVWPDNERIDNIGVNGGEALHYDKL